MQVNGKGLTLVSVFVTVLIFMGTNIIFNDRASRERDTNIRKDMVESERRINKNLDEIKVEQSNRFTQVLVGIERLKVKIEEQ